MPSPAPPGPAPCLYVAALDAGDGLVAALSSDDLDGAALHLDERGQLLAQIQGSALPPPGPELAERFRAQDAHLSSVLRARLTTLGDALAETSRTAAAHDGYASSGRRPASVVDTARRLD